ncbi:PREDICTED: PRAME family member 12-like [Chinchilla lanigera]|uniref:PRAME family member 12-like n=1 Tax=Chinchilla lanigera TaxID=34839 RepID=UPI000696DDCA|nr:PREDICTED: PRAME family member 12-like [Chinchilla lanigera]
MSTQSPPILQKLAIQSLLRDKALAMEAEDVSLVQKKMFKAMLDGLDMLFSQVCSRRLKLQMLDMWDVHQHFWRVWAKHKSEACSSEAMKRRNTEMSLWMAAPSAILPPQVHPGEGRPGAAGVQEACIAGLCPEWVTEFLEVLNLDSVQEVDVAHGCTFIALAHFAPFLGQMRNLHKLILSDIFGPAMISPERTEELFTQITSQFLKLRCLQEIYMDAVAFFEGHFDRVLRCLKCPLETLSLPHCQLSRSDWNKLPQIEQTRQLKHLCLNYISLPDFSPEPLRILLDNVPATLTTLRLDDCGITDAHVCTLLPSLSCCSQRTAFCFTWNLTSIGTMKKPLDHTARHLNVRKLNMELYSVPPEDCAPRHGAHKQMWKQVHEALRRLMKTPNHPRRVWFCVHHESCCNRALNDMCPSPRPACISI